MITAIDVANFFVNLYKNSENNDITNLKLNKLVYFSQAVHLVRFGKPFFEEEVEAWDLGPVIPSVYHTFKICGKNVIQSEAGIYDTDLFTDDELDLLLDIDENFGIYSGPTLVNITHKQGSPWKQCYNHNTQHTVISKEMMKTYFSHDKVQKREIDASKIPTIGYRNENGDLILPSEEYYKEDDDAYNKWKEIHV